MKVIHWLAVLVCAFAGLARAQGARTEPRYQSAFDGFRNWRTDEPVDWKRANDEMRTLGGHAGHLRGTPTAGARRPAPAGPREQVKPPSSGGSGIHHGVRQ